MFLTSFARISCQMLPMCTSWSLFLDFLALQLKVNFIEERRHAIIDKIVEEYYAQNTMEVRVSFVCAIGNPMESVTIEIFRRAVKKND